MAMWAARGGIMRGHLGILGAAAQGQGAAAHRVVHRCLPPVVVPAAGTIGVALEARRCARGATHMRHLRHAQVHLHHALPTTVPQQQQALPAFGSDPGHHVVGSLPLLQRDRG